MSRTVSELMRILRLTPLTRPAERERSAVIRDAIVCDLMSDVLAHGRPEMIWITVQVHLNVIAVAKCTGIPAVVVCNGLAVPQRTIARAQEENVQLFSSDSTAYHLCCEIYQSGIGRQNCK